LLQIVLAGLKSIQPSIGENATVFLLGQFSNANITLAFDIMSCIPVDEAAVVQPLLHEICAIIVTLQGYSLAPELTALTPDGVLSNFSAGVESIHFAFDEASPEANHLICSNASSAVELMCALKAEVYLLL